MVKKAEVSYAEQQRIENEARAAMFARSDELAKIIRPLKTAEYETGVDWTRFQRTLEDYRDEYGGLEMDPDFQRGHVWTEQKQQHFIENVLRGVVSSSGFLVQFNCPNWENDEYEGDLPRGFQCIDGLQRITAVLNFLDGKVRPFGLTPEDLAGSTFRVKNNYRFQLAVHTFESKADLLQHYVDLNSGGTPHSPEEIARVKAMREALLAGSPASKKQGGPSL